MPNGHRSRSTEGRHSQVGTLTGSPTSFTGRLSKPLRRLPAGQRYFKSYGTRVPEEQKREPHAPLRPFRDRASAGLCCTAHAKGDSQTAELNFRVWRGSVNSGPSSNPTLRAGIFAIRLGSFLALLMRIFEISVACIKKHTCLSALTHFYTVRRADARSV